MSAALAAAIAGTSLSSPRASAAAIGTWDFDAGGAIAAPYNTPAATSGIGTATQLGMNNNYTFNGGEGPGSVAFSDVLASPNASTGAGSFGWRVRGPSNVSGGGAGQSNGWNSQAPIGTQGAQFNVDTTGFGSIVITADVDTTTQAERNLAILYTLDDTAAIPTWVNATITSPGTLGTLATNSSSANTITGNYVQLGSGWNNQITAAISGADNDPNFAVEIVNASTGADVLNVGGAALNNSSGNWRYDNVTISGTAATPEPASLSLLALGAVGLLSRRRK